MNIMQFKYIPGARPTPRIAMFQDRNHEAFIQIRTEMEENLMILSSQELHDKYIHV